MYFLKFIKRIKKKVSFLTILLILIFFPFFKVRADLLFCGNFDPPCLSTQICDCWPPPSVVCFCIENPSSCFLPGTLVKTSTGAKKIEDIKIGDEVTSFGNDK